MATPLPTDNQEDQNSRYNPGELHAAEQFGSPLGHTNQNAREGESTSKDTSDNTNNVKAQEETPEHPAGPWRFNHNKNKQKSSFKSKFLNNKKKWVASGFIGTILLAIPIAFLSLMPLKLEMFIQNITGLASDVPSYAVEQRIEYLTTRALATRLLMAAGATDNNGNAIDGKLVFCKDGAIACSLFATWTADYFENKLGLTIDVEADGRARLGANAREWSIYATKADGTRVDDVVQRIKSNTEMRAYIRDEVRSNTKSSQLMTRYLARKILMKKYGVTHWRGPAKIENAANSLATAKANLRTAMFKNTVGKISPRVAVYLACLQDGASCHELLKSLRKTFVDPSTIEDEAQREAAIKQQAAAEAFNVALESAAQPNSNEGISKFISQRALGLVGGGVAVAGILDLAFGAVESLDQGALEQVGYDISTQTYTGFGFGDDGGIVVANDKMKAGDLDIDTIGAATALFDDAEQSPLMQAETGLMSDSSVANAATAVSRECATIDGPAMVSLQPGELVCPERKVVRDYSSSFADNPAWNAIAGVAPIWNDSVGKIFDIVNAALEPIIGILLDAPGIKQALELVGGAIQPLIEWFTSIVFDPPVVGAETTGANNYDGLSASIRIAQNELMLEGVDTDGSAMGAGGSLLTDQEVAAVTNQHREYEQQHFNNQPVLAKIFNPRLIGSFSQQLLLRMPTSVDSIATLPKNLLTAAPFTQSAFAAMPTDAVNPFNIPIYGYAVNDPALTADPGIYTEEECKELATAREESYGVGAGAGGAGKVATYTKSDPCALEKMAVGIALKSAGVEDDKYSLKDPGVTASNLTGNRNDTQASPGNAILPAGTRDELVAKVFQLVDEGKIVWAVPAWAANNEDDVRNHLKAETLQLMIAIAEQSNSGPLRLTATGIKSHGPDGGDHSDGIAIDIDCYGYDYSGTGQRDECIDLYNWLMKNHEALGVRQFIWTYPPNRGKCLRLGEEITCDDWGRQIMSIHWHHMHVGLGSR